MMYSAIPEREARWWRPSSARVRVSCRICFLHFAAAVLLVLTHRSTGSAKASDLLGADTVEMRRMSSARIEYITALAVTGKSVLIGDLRMDPHVGVVDRTTLRLTGRYGPDGDRQGRLLAASCIVPDERDPDRIHVYDRNRSVLAEFRISSRSPEAVSEQAYPSLPRARYCVWHAGERLLFHSYFPEYFAELGDGGDLRRTFSITPPFMEHDDLNMARFAIRPSGSAIALAYEYSARVDLLSADGTLSTTVRGPRQTNEVRYEIVTPPGGTMTHALVSRDTQTAYLDLAASERFVYALFSGCAGGPCRFSGTDIQVFGWDGAYVGRFTTDRRLLAIAVSPDDTTLYGVFAVGDRGYPQRMGEWSIPELR